MDSKDNVFLAKLQLLCDTFDEIDKMIEEQPDEQQKIDFEISDYLHLLQTEELTDESMLTVSKKLKSARLKRCTLQNTSHLMKSYNDNKQRIINTNTRGFFRSNIKNTMNRLNQDYRYRILEENDINELKNSKKEEVKKHTRKRKSKVIVSEEELRECVEKGMRTKDIADFFGITSSNLCHLKQKYGIASRGYNRK